MVASTTWLYICPAPGVVSVCQASRVPDAVRNATRDARSPSANTVPRVVPLPCLAPLLVTRPSTLRIAVARAPAALTRGVAERVPRLGTGDPCTLMSRPSRVTLPLSPLPNRGTPPTCWVQLR